MRVNEKPFPDAHAAVRALRQDAGLTVQALADKSGVDAEFLRRVESRRSRPTLPQFLRVADACGAGEKADEWRRWASECPWDFAGNDATVRAAYVVAAVVDREVHETVVARDLRDACDAANDMLRDHVEGLDGGEDDEYVAKLDEAVRLAKLGLEPDKWPPEIQVATPDNREAWSNLGDTHFDAHIFIVNV